VSRPGRPGGLGRRLARLVALALLMLPGTTVAAPGRRALTLAEVLDTVRGRHPAAAAAGHRVAAAEGDALAARGGFDPRLSVRGRWMPVGYYRNGQLDVALRQPTPLWGLDLEAGYRLGLGTYAVYKGDLQTLSAGEVRAGLSVPVWRDGPIDDRRAKVARAARKLDEAEAKARAKALELAGKAADAYWTWVAAGLRLRIARDLLDLARRRAAGLAAQAEAGAIPAIRLTDNERQVLEREAKVVAARRAFEQAAVALSLYYRDENGRPVVPDPARLPARLPAPPPPPRDLDALVRRAQRDRPEVHAMVAQRRARQVDARLARNRLAPELRLAGFVSRDFGQGPAWLAPTELWVGATFEMALPLRTARGRRQAAQARVRAVDAELRGLQDGIGAEVRAAAAALRAALRRVDLARAQVRAARILAEGERRRLAEGASDLVVVNLRELAAADAKRLEVDAVTDAHRAAAALRVASGRWPAPGR